MQFQKEKKCKRKLKSVAGLFGYKICCQNAFSRCKRSRATKSDAVYFSQVLYTKVKHVSCYDAIVHMRYDVTGQKLTDWPETLSRFAVSNTG